jgi:hypothetical protein
MKNIEHFIDQLNIILKDFDEIDKSAITGKYLKYTRTSMINLTSLIYDLSWVKKYNNEKGL